MKAWQRQIREKRELLERNSTLFGAYWEPLNRNISNANIKPVSWETAKAIIEDYEWLGSMANTTRHYGAFFDGLCAGVVCFGQCDGWTHRTVIKYKVPPEHTWVLSRGACVHWAHPHTGSLLISKSLRMLSRDTKAQIVIAYSDEEAGEIGTLYQATNWFYLGRCIRNAEAFIAPDGTHYHRNVVYDKRREMGLLASLSWSEMRDRLLQQGWGTKSIPDKHRYVYPFTRALSRRVAQDARPYPKRAEQESAVTRIATSDESVVQSHGSAPNSEEMA